MATALTSSPHISYFSTNRRPTQGILLSTHPYSTDTQPQCFPTRPPLSLTAHPINCPRRIRFAPLPDPRRSVLITDDGNELPFPQSDHATHFPAPPTPSPALESRHDYFSAPDSTSLSSISTDSKRNSDLLDPSSSSSTSSTPGTATPVSFTTTTPSEYDPNSSVPPSPISCPPSPLVAVSTRLSVVSTSSKHGPFSFLRGLKRNSMSSSSSSSNTLTPTPSIERTQTPTAASFSRRNFSAEEILTLGTINLFRASSSRDTSDNEGTTSTGWSLSRWSSAGPHHTQKEPNWGSPLARVSSTQSTQSTQSYQSKSKKSALSKGFRPSSTGGLRPNRKGTRMLNGRVYGVRPNANPFANARDEEPEFVEWGYGGMGSVKGATSAGAHGRWGRLQGQSVTSSTAAVQPTDEEDDGSGMMWVKKRREQREREKKEKEEREMIEKGEKDEDKEEEKDEDDDEDKVEKQHAEKPERRDELSRPGTASSAKTVSAASSCTATPCSPSSLPPLAITPSSSTPTPSSVPPVMVTSPAASAIEEEHVTRAIKVPAPHHYLHHRLHSRAGSKDAMMNVVVADAENKEKESYNGSRSNSESESESDVEHEEEEEESESDEDEEEGRRRRTAVSAGVEKISRHH